MARYYSFDSQKGFSKHSSKRGAIYISSLRGGVVFRHIDGIPNPWFCYAIKPDGSYKLDKSGNKKIFTPNMVDKYLSRHFAK